MTIEPAEAACLVVCATAAGWDVRTGEIPDWLTLPAILLGLALDTVIYAVVWGPAAGLVDAFLPSLGAAVALLAISGALACRDLLGMGDVKLLAAVGALLGWPLGLWAGLYTAVAGGVLAVAWALARGTFRRSLQNVAAIASRPGRAGDDGNLQLTPIPYGVAIFAGVAWVVLVGP